MNRWQQTAVVLALGLAIRAVVDFVEVAWAASTTDDVTEVAAKSAVARVLGALLWGWIAVTIYGDERRPWHRGP